MMEQRFGVRAVAALFLVLASACGDDSDDDSGNEETTPDSSTSAPADAGSGASRDASSGGNDAAASSVDASTGTQDARVDSSTGADASTADSGAAAKSIVQTAVGDGRFTTLAKALTDTSLVATLEGAGPFTVFAPTDAAFMALGQATLSSLTNEQLKNILLYHVVMGEVLSTGLKAGPVKTASGISAFVSLTGGAKINGASVTTADVRASNGVIHVIDKVLLPPDVVEAAQLAGSFTSLIAAATRANLATTLKTTQNITVFAPTDAAFMALGQSTVDGLSVMQLADVLKYHVVGQRKLSTELTAGMVPTLLTGKSLTVSLTGGVKINDANVAIADVVATNGVIHVVDKVLLPPQ